MKSFEGFRLIPPAELEWKLAQPMQIPNADFLERTGSLNLGARLWRMPPMSANTWHKHVIAEEFYFVIEGTGRMRVGGETLTVPRHGGVLVGPDRMRQVFNDTDEEVLWLIVGAPEAEFPAGEPIDMKAFWPEDPTQLPPELEGHPWPPDKPGHAPA
jgi:mannose-6-phosphate isomerase-like protein (cupin superfamily)